MPPGKPPKSNDEIRGALESLSGSAPKPEAGPRPDGLADDDRICIDSFYSREIARDLQVTLNRAGIPSTLHTSGRMSQVLVDYEDRERANAILAEHRREHPDGRKGIVRREYDYMILFSIVGLSVGMIILVGAWDNPRSYVAPLPFAAVGASTGHVVDRILEHHRRTGRLGIGVWEFLVLATIPALLAFIWNFVPGVINP